MRGPLRLMLLVVLGAAAAGRLAVAENQSEPPPPATDMTQQGGTLSDKLGATNGVIHPKDSVDPAMEKAAPATGTMPVIPPAGTPGGTPGVQPK